MPAATITSKGQVTIPAEIRQALGLSMGDQVVFTQLADGTTVIRAKRRSLCDLKGMLQRTGAKPVDVAQMSIGRR